MTTYSAKISEISKKWYVIDATDLILGRLAAEIAHRLIGKHKPTYTPHMDCGDNIIVVNVDKIHISGNENKIYYRHTGYPGGIKSSNAKDLLAGKYSHRVLLKAVQRMISRNKLGRKRMKNLYLYNTDNHPHTAQKPEILDIAALNEKNKKRK